MFYNRSYARWKLYCNPFLHVVLREKCFTAENLNDNSVTLKTCHGTYVVIESTNNVNNSAKHRNGWEAALNVVLLGRNKIAIKSSEDRYVTADVSGRLTASSRSIGLWETFEIEIVSDSETRKMTTVSRVSKNGLLKIFKD